MADALAQACVHSNCSGAYCLKTEAASATIASSSSEILVELLDEIRADGRLAKSAQWEDDNKMLDRVLARAPEEMISYASKWSVSKSNLDSKTAEMIKSAIYFTAAAQSSPKQVKFDDDSHAVKLRRAVRNAELLTEKWAEDNDGAIKGIMLEMIGNMIVDSVEDTGAT